MRTTFSFMSLLTLLLASAASFAQVGGQIGGALQSPGASPQAPQTNGRAKSTDLEVGLLYGTAGTWGVGTGIWFDAETGIEDPGIELVPPGVLGAGAVAGVFMLDNYVYRTMPEGMPSAIATGMLVGAGEGLGIASFQFVRAKEQDEWSFKGLARSELVGSTLGGLAGYGFYYWLRPKPKTNLFVGSSVLWGSVIGSQFGGGASNGDWGQANDGTSLGGLIGFNLALAGALGLSSVWSPSWDQFGWMWAGFGIGQAVSLPVYLFYIGSEHDARRGLIFQGVAGTIGVAAGAFIGKPERRGALFQNEVQPRRAFARILGGSLAPTPGGIGAQVYGELW